MRDSEPKEAGIEENKTMAEKGNQYHYQMVKSVGDSWIVLRSKKYADRIYYFNTTTGQAVWNLSKAELLKAKMMENQSEGLPEPKGPPMDNMGPIPTTMHQTHFRHSIATPQVYNKQIINNQYPKPFLYPPPAYMPQFYQQEAPLHYNTNVWAVPPVALCANPATQLLMGSLPSTGNQFLNQYNMKPPNDVMQKPETSYSNQFRNENNFVNDTKNYEMSRQSNLVMDDYNKPSHMYVWPTHVATGTKLSDRFKKISNYSSSEEVVKPSSSISEKQNVPNKLGEFQDLRQVLMARRKETNSNHSESFEEGSSNLRVEHDVDLPENIEGQMKYQNFDNRTQARDTSPNITREDPPSSAEDDDEWLSENMQLQGTKAVIDVAPLMRVLGNPNGNWFLIPDTNVFLNHLRFLNLLANSDKQCKLVITSPVYGSLQECALGAGGGAMESGGGASTAGGGASAPGAEERGAARSACRFVEQMLNCERAIIEHQVEAKSNPLEDCGLRLIQQNLPFIVLSDNTELLRRINAVQYAAFTVEDIKEFLSSQRIEMLSDNKVDLPMTITITNDKSASPTFLTNKTKRNKIIFGPKEPDIISLTNKESQILTKKLVEPKVAQKRMSTETQVSPIKKMVSVEVQTELLIPIDDSITFKIPEHVAPKNLTKYQAVVTTNKAAENALPLAKRREIRLKQNTEKQNSAANDKISKCQSETKTKRWRRRRVDLAQKTDANTVVTNELIEKLIKTVMETKQDTKNALEPVNLTETRTLNNMDTVQTKVHSTNTIASLTKSKVIQTNIESQTIEAQIDNENLILNQEQMMPQSASNQTIPKSASNQTIPKSTSNKTIPKLASNQQTPISASNQTTSNSTIIQTMPKSPINKTKPKSASNQKTVKASTPKKILKPAKFELRPAQFELKSTQNKTRFDKNHQPKQIINSTTTNKYPFDKTSEVNSDKGMDSPKKMKDFMSQIVFGAEKTFVEESAASSSDVISNTRSSVCSEKGVVMQRDAKLHENKTKPKIMLKITDDEIQESLRTGADEWIPRFEQTMEEVLTQVLQLSPPLVHEMPPPWTIMESTECIKKRYNYNSGVLKTGTEFSIALFKVLENQGEICRDLTPTRFLELFNLAVNFLLELQALLPDCEDLGAALAALQQLLADIRRLGAPDDTDTCDTNRKTLPEKTNTTPTKKSLPEEISTSQSVKIIRKFNCDMSFEKLMEKRSKQPSKEVEKPINQKQTENLSSNSKVNQANRKTFSTDSASSNLSVRYQSTCYNEFQEQLNVRQNLDMDLLDYTDDFDYTETDFDDIGDHINFSNHENNFDILQDKPDQLQDNFDQLNYKFDQSQDNIESIQINSYQPQDKSPVAKLDYNKENIDYAEDEYQDNHNVNNGYHNAITTGAHNNSADNHNDIEMLVNTFLKEMKNTFQNVNLFCEQTYEELRQPVKITTTRRTELQEESEKAKSHINHLLKTLTRDIISKCTEQAKILHEALTSISGILGDTHC